MNNSGQTCLKDFVLLAQNAFPKAEKVFNVQIENIQPFNTNPSISINVMDNWAVNIKGRVKFKLEDVSSYSAIGSDVNFMLQQAVHEKLRCNTYFDTSVNMRINLEKQTITANFCITVSSSAQLNEFVKGILYDIVDNTLLA